MREFDWLGGCKSCNIDCCHNTDKYIPENECIRADRMLQRNDMKDMLDMNRIHESYDNRPLECRLFPFDLKEIDGKAMWIVKDNCHETPRLDYEKFMGFFERKFFREIPIEQIKKYLERRRTEKIGSPSIAGYIPIKEVDWPSSYIDNLNLPL